MSSIALRTTILWIHALGGVVWVGAAACFAIVAGVVDTDEEEGRAMMRRIVPAINGIGVAAMLFIALSGIVNTYIAGVMRHFSFSHAFVAVLGVKLGIFLAMLWVLAASYRAQARLSSNDAAVSGRAVSRLILLNVAVMGLGGSALLLGLWLLGS